MKIALALYPINDLGGIINHTEQLSFGLRELGHDVNLHILYYQSKFNSVKTRNQDKNWRNGAFVLCHQNYGWNARPWIEKLAYKGKDNLNKTLDILSKYDMIIWEIPVPTKLRAHYGNNDWPELYTACKKNIAIIHDGNALSTPWILEVKDHITALACVHQCAFNTSKKFGIPTSLIFNPHDLSKVKDRYDYKLRNKGFLSLQVFKALKRVDDLIRAIPYLPSEYKKYIAGGGIEQRYMVSKNKIKPKYICDRKNDPNLNKKFIDKPIWEVATTYGMDYLGFISERKRDKILRKIRTLIDPSWSQKYAINGGHFNRVFIEAIKQGTIPIAINKGISDNLEGENFLFKPNINYIMIDYRVTPKEYAQNIELANELSTQDAELIQSNNYDLLELFERKNIANQFIRLSKLKKCGYYKKIVRKKTDKNLLEESKKEFESFFRGK